MASPRIVVVGGGTAGLTAADAAKRTCPDSKVTILGEEPFTYRRPALTSIIEGEIKEPKQISIFPQTYLSSLNVEMRAGVRVVEIDSRNNLVKHTNSRGSTETVNYDRLILATGGYATKPILEGVDKAGVFTFRTFHDALEISRWAEKVSSATVVGAGFIGLLAAEALAKRGLDVNLLARSRTLRRILEADLAKTIQSAAGRHGVKVLTGVSIEKIGGGDHVEWVETSAGKVYSDLVVFAIGVKPSTELAEAAGVSVGKFGITINERMQTSIEDIYAAGDCIEVVELITQRKAYLPIGSLAAAEGKIAGSNSAGGSIESKGFLRAQDEELFDLHIVSIGHATESAREANLKAEAVDITTPRSYSLRGIRGLQAKFILNADNDLIGAQLITSRHDLLAKSYPPILLNLIREETNLTEALENFKRRYRTLPEYILWRSLR